MLIASKNDVYKIVRLHRVVIHTILKTQSLVQFCKLYPFQLAIKHIQQNVVVF